MRARMQKAEAFRLSKSLGTRVPMTLAHVARSPARFNPEVIDRVAESNRTLNSFDHTVSNLRFTNLCSHEFSPEQLHLLGLGLKFQSASDKPGDLANDLQVGFNRLKRSRTLESYFLYGEPRDEDQIAPEPRFIVKSDWSPPISKSFPDEDLKRYTASLETVKESIEVSAELAPLPPPLHR